MRTRASLWFVFYFDEFNKKDIFIYNYSVNKRAKNYRDKARQYRYSYYHGDNQREEMERYYGYKEQLLSYFTPKCIHKQFVGSERERVYDYESEYNNRKGKNIVWENCYYDYDEDREVWFYDYETNVKKYLYFLYYVIGDYSFHTPITNPKAYDYPIEKIDDDFTTVGKDVKELVSAQFVIKVLETLATEECQLHVNGEVIEIKPKDEPVYIEKSPAMQEPTFNQIDYIRALCTFYECDVPDVKTSGQASRWLSNFLKTHDYKTDKRKAQLRERYQKIFDDHASGMTMEQLIEKYRLTKPTIRKAIKAIQNNTV